jgi:hypothetical protein
VTAHPTAEWIAQQITEAFPWNEAPRYLIRDRDGVYGSAVRRRLRAMGIRDKPISAGSPWQNCFAERLIGSIRRECIDHVVSLGEEHLRRLLRSYASYYNETRIHRSLNKDAPIPRPDQRIGRIASNALVGGLHRCYAAAAHLARSTRFQTDRLGAVQRKTEKWRAANDRHLEPGYRKDHPGSAHDFVF